MIEKALPWMVSYSANHRKSMGLKMIFVPTFPIWVGRFFEKNKSLDIFTNVNSLERFSPQKICWVPSANLAISQQKPTRTAPCMAPPVAPNPGPAAPLAPAPAAPPVPATAPAVPQAEPQGGPVGSQMEGTSKIWEILDRIFILLTRGGESLMNPIMFVVRW